ncbi:helix-turn-helix domain-containing protein [Kibdelosporangium persicum]
MANDLLRLLGVDPDSQVVKSAREDDADLANLMRSLYELRRSSGLTQAEVANRMGTTQSAVSDLERTAIDPQVTTLQRYARAVGAALKLRTLVVNDEWKTAGRLRARSHVQPRSDRHHEARLVDWTLSGGSETCSA